MKKIIVIIVVLAFAVGAFVWKRSLDSEASPPPAGNVAAAKSDAKLSASAVLSIDPATRSAPAPVMKTALLAASPFMQAFIERKDWAGLYRRLKDAPATPESQYLQAEILAACAKRVPVAGTAPPKMDSREEKRAKFLASLAPNDPQLEKRKAAWEQMNVDRCGELAQIEYNAADVSKLVEAAAAASDPRAKAWQLMKQMQDDREAAGRKSVAAGGPPGPTGYEVTDAQFATMRQLLASQDPLVISELRNVLSSTIDSGSVRIGPNQIAIDHQAMYNALALVACDFGAPCAQDSPAILIECAVQGRCSAGNLYDHTLYYGVSPYGAQLVEQYRQWLGQMIGSGDMGQLNLVRGPNTPGGSYMFGGRRRP